MLMRLQVSVISFYPQPDLSMLQTCVVHYVAVIYEQQFELVPKEILHNSTQKIGVV
jgi:hypothetical protein